MAFSTTRNQWQGRDDTWKIITHTQSNYVTYNNSTSTCSISSIGRRGYYLRAAFFFGKSADTNVGWIRYVWAIQWWLLDAVSSKRSLSVLVSGMERSRTTWTALALVLARWPSPIIHIHVRVHVLRIAAMATIQGWHLFRSELPTNRGGHPIDKIRHSWFAKSDVQECQQRLSNAFDLLLIFAL